MSFSTLIYTEAEVREAVLAQLKYYLSAENLMNDAFTISQMDDFGFIPIEVLAEFHRLQRMTHDLGLIQDVLKGNPQFFEFNVNMSKVRPRENPLYWAHLKRLNEQFSNGQQAAHGIQNQCNGLGGLYYNQHNPTSILTHGVIGNFGAPIDNNNSIMRPYHVPMHGVRPSHPKPQTSFIAAPAADGARSFPLMAGSNRQPTHFVFNPDVPDFIPGRKSVSCGDDDYIDMTNPPTTTTLQSMPHTGNGDSDMAVSTVPGGIVNGQKQNQNSHVYLQP